MTRILVAVTFALQMAAPAFADDCSVYLDSTYTYSSIFSRNRNETRLAMKVEAGSIEDLHPGVIRRLLILRSTVHKLSRTPSAESIARAVAYVNMNLRTLQDDILDRRFDEMISSSMRFIQSKQDFQRLLATLWELTVACAYSGEAIFLNKTISEIYPDEFPAVESRLQGWNFKIDREIDIAILDHNGSWRWIEVKDWSTDANIDRLAQRKILHQSRAQSTVRRALKLDIKMILLLKHGLNRRELEEFRHSSRHDEIRFVFPINRFLNQ